MTYWWSVSAATLSTFRTAAGPFPFAVVDLNGAYVLMGQAWVETMGTATKGRQTVARNIVLSVKAEAAFDSKANPGSAGFSAIASAFSEIGEDEFGWLAGTTLSHVTVVTPGKKNLSLRDMDAVAEHFDGRWAGMYELMFQVWSLEKMLPFEMSPETWTDGSGTGRTAT